MSERKELDVLLRNDFYSYVQRVFYELGNEKFIPNWHLEVLCDALERARRGEIKRLIINVPPRSLKSIVVNVAYSTWLWDTIQRNALLAYLIPPNWQKSLRAEAKS